jgi:hypothetical protein
VQQRGRLVVDRRIGVLTERRRLLSRRRGLRQTDVADLELTQHPPRDVQQVVQVEVDHRPSRSSASA